MPKNQTGRTILILAILLVFVFGIFGIPKGFTGADLKSAFVNRIHLGLDLSGGTHLILQVMVGEAVGATSDNDIARMQTDLQQAGATGAMAIKPDPKQHPEMVHIQGVSPDKAGAVQSILSDHYGTQYNISSGADNSFTLTMKPTVVTDLEQRALAQSIETIRDRVDGLGVTNPVIEEYGPGTNQILVELPDVDDPANVKSVIQSTARLEIHEVLGGPYTDEQAALQANGGSLPLDGELMKSSDLSADAGQYYLLRRISIVAGSDFRDAQPSVDVNQRPDVNFILTRAGGDRFYQFTSTNIGKSMAIVLDNSVREVATIQGAIRDQGQISGGGFTKETADNLSLMLRTGALPASIHFLEERTVGPSLGADSIRQGVIAAIAGFLAVMVFMLIYYRGAGINADLALILNLVILLGFMGFTTSVLTLPGIAGVILTIGMGVDSNVLIFERIREELRAGKSAAAAVDQGFGHAWLTIVDTHVTTIVSAAILFMFGTGPVKGFAVTLTFGLLANLFTAVFVSRTIFDAILNRKQRGEAISI
ncbi:MAG TPA: protein translocase subunit SecD [Acidobacteriaceae bacterium]|jgi:preprotein translocase subunit SecD|nr:protein translocase subunit SecD [Acidobacteriaceae bacterium]